MSEVLLAILIISIGLIGLVSIVLGAIDLFAFAGQQGFVGLAAYVACWVFLAPVTATIAVLLGLYLLSGIVKRKFA
jgi:hypothetical protein